MNEYKRGIITGLYDFQVDENGPFLVSEGYAKGSQYFVVVWLADDIRQYDGFIMVFVKEPGGIIQVAEWSGKVDNLSLVMAPLNRILNHYSRGDKGKIMLGVGRNAYGELLIFNLKDASGYCLYREVRRDSIHNVLSEEAGISCGEGDKLGLVEGLKVMRSKIHLFSTDRAEALRSVVINKGECLIPDKNEALVMCYAGACRMNRDYPYRKPVDMAQLNALAKDMHRSMFRF